MRLLPMWERSPFTTRRVSEQGINVSGHDESLRRNTSSELPSNPSPSSHTKQPIDLSHMIDANTCQDVAHRHTGEFSSYNYISSSMDPLSASTNPPRLDLKFTTSPSLLDMFSDSSTMDVSQPLETRDGKTRNNEPPRQISNSSSTGRSRRSASSSRQSRPSSRSSFDEQIPPIEASKVTKYRDSENEHPKRQQTIVGQVAVMVKPSKNVARPNSLPAGILLNIKSSPARATGQMELDDIVNGLRLLGASRLPVSDSSKSKRGAKLGSLMQDPPPIRSSFVLSNLPAIKSKNSSTENSEPLNEAADPKQTERDRDSSPDEDAATTERVLLGILRNLDSVRDLASTAMVSKGFYRVFRLHERDLVNRILYATSLPAWELRYILQGEQKRGAFKLRSFQRDVSTIKALHSFIFMRCQHVCRPSTLDALLEADTARKAELDNALWRIWSFCRLFGKNRDQYDVKMQIAWLEGGGRHRKSNKTDMLGVGNGRGLSLQELEDLSEMWRCLKTLLEGFKGREVDARNAGIFDNCIIDEAENATEQYFLESWIHELLCLGPKAVLTLNSCSFEQAKVLGVTKWTPPTRSQSRGEFFEAAVEEVYRERLVTEARLTASQFEKQMRARPKPLRAASDYTTVSSQVHHPARELRIVTEQFQPLSTILHQSSVSSGSPSLSSECRSISPVSPSLARNCTDMRPAAFSTLSMTTAASAKLGSSLFPAQSSASSQISPRLGSNPFVAIEEEEEFVRPGIPDPVDKAMDYLVKELGFPEFKAKQALAMSDDGQGINIHKAVDLLMIGSESQMEEQSPIVAELPGIPITSPISTLSPKPSIVHSPKSASSQDDMKDGTVQPGIVSRRRSFRVADTDGHDDYSLRRETHILNTMRTMCDPVQGVPSTASKPHHPLSDIVKHDAPTGSTTSKYTIAGRRHSHKTTLSNGSVKFNVDELRPNISIHKTSPLTSHPPTRAENFTINSQPEGGNRIRKHHQPQMRTVTTTRTVTTHERKPSRGWTIKEAFKKREEQYDQPIGYALFQVYVYGLKKDDSDYMIRRPPEDLMPRRPSRRFR